MCFYMNNDIKISLLYSGAIGARLSSEASTVKILVGDALSLVVQNIATVIAALVIAFIANWILAFIVLAVSPIILMEAYVQTKSLRGFSADAKVLLNPVLLCFT